MGGRSYLENVFLQYQNSSALAIVQYMKKNIVQALIVFILKLFLKMLLISHELLCKLLTSIRIIVVIQQNFLQKSVVEK